MAATPSTPGCPPNGWFPLPKGLSLHAAMALGTAGFTAALGIVRMEENGLKPSKGPLIVTGATGGVGSLAVDMLAARGYQVTALTGKEAEADYLKGLGAADGHVPLGARSDAHRPLDKALWAGAVDNLGGDVLSWIVSTMKQGGTIASIGLAASPTLNTTVMPFILRGACLLGIDSGYIGEPYRSGVWQRLAAICDQTHLQAMTRTIGFDDLPGAFDDYIKGPYPRPRRRRNCRRLNCAGVDRNRETRWTNPNQRPRILIVDESRMARATLIKSAFVINTASARRSTAKRVGRHWFSTIPSSW
jgi:putative YhdH/YhfP family quinone oxidoreductase